MTYSKSDSNQTEFTIEASGVSLNYQWMVNDTYYNATKDGTLVYPEEEVPNGRTKVKVVVWSTKYDGTDYSDEQLLIIDKGIVN